MRLAECAFREVSGGDLMPHEIMGECEDAVTEMRRADVSRLRSGIRVAVCRFERAALIAAGASRRPNSPECLGLHVQRVGPFGDLQRASKRGLEGVALRH